MEKQFKIEKGIPVPERKGKSFLYPFEKMEVGDSFIFSNTYSRSIHSYASNAARNWKNHSPIKGVKDWFFTTRKIDNSIRIWRVK